jgi:hypothetical protein
VRLDLEVLLKTRLLVTASSGGGKTGTLFQICETFAGQVQIIILDWEGEFSPLRTKYPFVLAGPGGETPAAVKTARLLAHRLLELHASAICDIYELPHDQKHAFVKEFLEAMIDAPKALWHPVLVIVDEAHLVAPEKGQGESVATGAVIDMASRGRKRGFCLIPATQRLAKLSKNVAAECQNVLVGRTTQVDQARAADVLNLSGKAVREEFFRRIGRMPTAEFFAYGMAFGAGEPEAFHVTRPETLPRNEAKRLVVPPTPKAIEGMLPQLSDIPVEAEKKAKTEEELRAELRTTQRRIRELEAGAGANHDEEIRMLKEELEAAGEAIEKARMHVEDRDRRIAAARLLLAEEVTALLNRVAGLLEAGERPDLAVAMKPAPTPIPRQIALAHVQRPPRAERPADGEELTGPEQRILDALAWFEAVGVPEPEQPAVAFMAGYVYGAGGYNNPKGRLNKRGLVEYLPGDRLKLTAEGRTVANFPQIQPTNEALQEAVMAKLGGPEQRILAPLLACYPKGMDNTALAEAAGYVPNAGGYNNPRGRLKSLGLVKYESGMVFARDILFPENS